MCLELLALLFSQHDKAQGQDETRKRKKPLEPDSERVQDIVCMWCVCVWGGERKRAGESAPMSHLSADRISLGYLSGLVGRMLFYKSYSPHDENCFMMRENRRVLSTRTQSCLPAPDENCAACRLKKKKSIFHSTSGGNIQTAMRNIVPNISKDFCKNTFTHDGRRKREWRVRSWSLFARLRVQLLQLLVLGVSP